MLTRAILVTSCIKGTHLVIGSPTRSEKYLAACAAGKWVVRPSFIRKSAESTTFVEEAEHEIRELPSKSKHSNGDALGKAPKRWRLILTNDPERSGAFDGWKVLLCVGQSKLGGFQRLLTAGGADIVKDARSVYLSEFLQYARGPAALERNPFSKLFVC